MATDALTATLMLMVTLNSGTYAGSGLRRETTMLTCSDHASAHRRQLLRLDELVAGFVSELLEAVCHLPVQCGRSSTACIWRALCGIQVV